MPKKSAEQLAVELVKEFKPLKTTQDAVDQAACELYVADLLRKNADARYEVAKKKILDDHADLVETIRNTATERMTKCNDYTHGEEWSIQIAANTPAKRVNVDELRTELVKAGVNIKTIDTCIAKVEKLSAPATIIKGIPRPKTAEVA